MKAKRYLINSILRRQSSNTLEKFYSYSTIKLKTYIDIANTGNVTLLAINPKHIDLQTCQERWEEIIEKNSRANGSVQYFTHVNSLKALNYLIIEYSRVRLSLIKSAFVLDNETIDFLKSRGYVLKATSGVHTASQYEESIAFNLRKSENMITKIRAKQKELQASEETPTEPVSFEQIIVNLNAALSRVASGFYVNEDITLASYNEYSKIVKKYERNKKGRSNKR